MQQDFFDVPGHLVSPSQLKIPKARELALALEAGRLEYAKLIESKVSENGEVVVFDVEVEIPQLRVHPIQPRERLSVTFEPTDKRIPKTEALRCDFPQVPHLNLHLQEFPRSLCIYAERYESVKRRWTAARFVQNIRDWLALTAKGKLHQTDQPLEPVLLDFSGSITIPSDLGAHDETPDLLWVTKPMIPTTDDKPFLIAQRQAPSQNDPDFLVSVHRSPPHVHGVINRYPATLGNLASMVHASGLDLLEDLRQRLKLWHQEIPNLRDLQVLILILFPRTRTKDGPEERVDPWTFWSMDSLHILGSKLGVWEKQGEKLGLLIPTDSTRKGGDISLGVLNTSYELTADLASRLNGCLNNKKIDFAAIGQGALGSQVVLNLARSCFGGTWTLIDNDILMPHNLARHVLFKEFIGSPKADGVAMLANEIVSDFKSFSPLRVDILSPGSQEQSLRDALQKSAVILDMSASVSVARRLSIDIKEGGRRISLFLSPTGEDLILLAEDRDRETTLDAIEMQYYRSVLTDQRLEDHLKPKEGQQRYGQSCRDLTFTLPQNLVSMHAAIGAAALQNLIDLPQASITIWRSDTYRNLQCINVSPKPVIRIEKEDWTIVTDEGLLERLFFFRKERLPNETGGVLLGAFDVERRLIYITHSLLSPPDSLELSTGYIRGCRGLNEALIEVGKNTNEMMEYIGEWHSHPPSSGTAPSNYDFQLFKWLAETMSRDGLPAVMIIVGDTGNYSIFVGEMPKD